MYGYKYLHYKHVVKYFDYHVDENKYDTDLLILVNMCMIQFYQLFSIPGGLIDYGHHANYPKRALIETVELERAVAKALELTNEDETLIVVSSDHSHVFTVGGGFPSRGNPILGNFKLNA